MVCAKKDIKSELRENKGKNLLLVGDSEKWVLAGRMGATQAEGTASVRAWSLERARHCQELG